MTMKNSKTKKRLEKLFEDSTKVFDPFGEAVFRPSNRTKKEWKGWAIMCKGEFLQLKERMGENVQWVLAIFESKELARKEHESIELDDEEIVEVLILPAKRSLKRK